jgi:hypothetical protein
MNAFIDYAIDFIKNNRPGFELLKELVNVKLLFNSANPTKIFFPSVQSKILGHSRSSIIQGISYKSFENLGIMIDT